MNTALRTWATPLTAGLFIIMAITGGLMFFHLDTGLNKAAHEWLGWGMLAAVVAHLGLHWRSLQRQLTLSRPAQFTLALSLLVLAGSFFGGQRAEGASPPGLAIQAIARAPLTSVAPLTGKSLAQVQRELAGMGLDAANAERSLNELTGHDRARLGQAVRTLFAPVP
jgi:Domain of unknown function (DUF4405)